jgi:hypothetical protein
MFTVILDEMGLRFGDIIEVIADSNTRLDRTPNPTWTAGPVFAVQNGRNAEG